MERVIIQSGPCGLFQVVHVLLTQSTRFALAWTVNFMMFGNFDPGWRCVPRDRGGDVIGSRHRSNNVTDTSTSRGGGGGRDGIGNMTSRTHYSPSDSNIRSNAVNNYFENNDNYSNNNNNDNNNINNSSDSSFSIYNGFDFDLTNYVDNETGLGVGGVVGTGSGRSVYSGTCDIIDSCRSIEFNPSSSTIVTEFGLVCDKTWVISFILFMQFIGMLVGSLVWGQVGERFGRRVSVYGSTATLAVCNTLAVFCTSWETYLTCSVFMGLGGIGILTCVPVYSMEFLSPKWRGMFASLPVWNLASCCFAAVVILLKNWWHIHLVNAVLTTAVCLGFFWVPESPRWLAVNGKRDKAIRVVEKMARVNGKPMPDFEVLQKLAGEENDENNKSTVKRYTYIDLFRTKRISIIVAKLSVGLVIAICTYNTLGFGVYSLPGNFYVNFIISSCSEIPAVLLVGFLANRIGRRWCGFVFSFIQTFCFCVIIFTSLVVEDGDVSDIVIKVMAFVSRGGAVSILSIISPIAVELLPTVVRSIGLGFILMVSRLGGLVAPFLLPHDRATFVVCFIVLAVAGVVNCLDFLSLPETNRKPLPDTLMDGEEEEEVVVVVPGSGSGGDGDGDKCGGGDCGKCSGVGSGDGGGDGGGDGSGDGGGGDCLVANMPAHMADKVIVHKES